MGHDCATNVGARCAMLGWACLDGRARLCDGNAWMGVLGWECLDGRAWMGMIGWAWIGWACLDGPAWMDMLGWTMSVRACLGMLARGAPGWT
eukprot:2831064-Prymnesium_polylepis.1